MRLRWRLVAWIVVCCVTVPLHAADPNIRVTNSLGWSLDKVLDHTSLGDVTGVSVTVTGATGCNAFTNGGALTTDTLGQIYCSNDDGGSGGSTSPGGSTTQAQYNNAGSFGGSSGLTLNATQITDLTFNTGAIASSDFTTGLSDEQGSGAAVFATSPTLTTPTIGAATATSIAIGANTLNTTEWGNLDGQDQAVLTTSSPTFANILLAEAGPDIRATPTGGEALHLGAEVSGGRTIAMLGDATSGRQHFLMDFSNNVDYLPQHPNATYGLGTTGEGRLFNVGEQHQVKEFWWPCPSMHPTEAADSIAPVSKDTGTNLDWYVCAFDATTDEGRTVFFKVPSDADPTATITFRAYWYSTATSGTVVWDARHNGGVTEERDPDATLTTVSSAADTVAAIAGQLNITTWTTTMQAAGWQPNELVVMAFYRDPDADSMAADALAFGFSVEVPRI